MVFQDDVMTEGASNSRPPLLKGHNYGFWKLRMKAYIRSIDERAWMTVEEGYLAPNKTENGVTVSKPRSEWSTNEFELAKWHHRAVNAIFGGVDSRQFSYIQNLETAKEAWDALRVTNEGTKAVKKSRLQLLTSQFEVLQMGEEDKFVDFQDKLLDIANKCQALGSPIYGERLNWKILRSLPKRFKAKVTAIEESKDVDDMSLDELLGSLQTFEACMKPKAKNKGLALKVVKEASSSEEDEEMALLVRKFRKFLKKGAKPYGKYSRDKEVKKSFTPPHERSGHVKSNRKVQCFKCKKFGHFASDCPSGDSKRDKKGKAMAATWSEDDESSDEKSSSDESSSEEELVSNFVGFTASYSSLDDTSQDSLEDKVDSNHQVCLNENPTYDELLAKVKSLEKKLKIALSEVDEKDDLINIQVDEFVATTRRLLSEKNAIAKKLREVEEVVLERDRIISNLKLGGLSDAVVEEKLIEASLPTSKVVVDKKAPKKRRSKIKNKAKNKVLLDTSTSTCVSPIPEGKISSFVPICHFCNTIGHIKPKCYKFIEYCNMENASRNREIAYKLKHAKAFEYGKHVNDSMHAKSSRNVKNKNLVNIDNAHGANNVGKKSINDIIVNQVVEELYSRFNIVVNKNLDDVFVNSPKTKFVKGECSYQ